MSVLNRSVALFGSKSVCERIESILKSTPMNVIKNIGFSTDNFLNLIEVNFADYYFVDIAEYCYKSEIGEVRKALIKMFIVTKEKIDPKRLLLHVIYLKNDTYRNQLVNEELRKIYFDIISLMPGINVISSECIYDFDFIMCDGPYLESEISRILILEYGHILSDYEIRCSIEENTLKAKIVLGPTLRHHSPEEFRYRFFLLKDSQAIKKIGPISQNEIVFHLDESGAYIIQGYVHSDKYHVFIRSDTYSYYTKDFGDKYNEFKKSKTGDDGCLRALKIIKKDNDDIFQDFVIISSELPRCIPKTASTYGIKELNVGLSKNISLFARDYIKNTNGSIIFSGFVKVGSKIYFNRDDLTNLLKTEIVNDEFGCYSMVFCHDGSITISKDLLGYSRIWYYVANDYTIISNRYSLLLNVLCELRLSPEMNFKKVKMMLSNIGNQFYAQNFTHEMDIKGVKQLPIDRKMMLKNSKLKFEFNENGRLLSTSRILNYEEYLTLLSEAVYEIKDNLLAIYDRSPIPENIIVDITGGLDSRVIYSVLSNLPDFKHKVRLRTQGSRENSDVQIASILNSTYRFEYDMDPEEREIRSFDESYNKYRESWMGQIYSHNINPYVGKKFKFHINGGTGDALCRSEYSRHYFKEYGGYSKNLKDMARAWLSWVSPTKIVGDHDIGISSTKIVENEMGRIPVESTLEKMDKMYVYFRNSYHFDPQPDYDTKTLYWMPLQSKKLILLNHYTHDAFHGIKLETDLIKCANPMLQLIPFEKKEDVEDTKRNQQIFGIDGWVKSLPVLESTIEEWEHSKKNKVISISGEKDPKINDSEINTTLSRTLLIYAINKCPDEFDNVFGMALYNYLCNNSDSAGRMLVLRNKLQSLVDQMSIIESWK